MTWKETVCLKCYKPQLLQSVARIRYQLSDKNLFSCIKRFGNNIQKLARLSLKFMLLRRTCSNMFLLQASEEASSSHKSFMLMLTSSSFTIFYDRVIIAFGCLWLVHVRFSSQQSSSSMNRSMAIRSQAISRQNSCKFQHTMISKKRI